MPPYRGRNFGRTKPENLIWANKTKQKKAPKKGSRRKKQSGKNVAERISASDTLPIKSRLRGVRSLKVDPQLFGKEAIRHITWDAKFTEGQEAKIYNEIVNMKRAVAHNSGLSSSTGSETGSVKSVKSDSEDVRSSTYRKGNLCKHLRNCCWKTMPLLSDSSQSVYAKTILNILRIPENEWINFHLVCSSGV